VLFAAAGALVAVFGLFAAWWYVTTEPQFGTAPVHLDASVDPARLEGHVRTLAATPRDFSNLGGLEVASQYIHDQLVAAGVKASLQPYEVGATTYYNVGATVGPDTPKRIGVGAHYDTAGPLPGADDNASGIAGVIELARALSQADLQMQVELVAWCLEEPPYFRTPEMGSAVHARRLKEEGANIEAAFSLEMLGFFSDEPGSQTFPSRALGWLYRDSDIGNFITVVSTFGQDGLGGRVSGAMRAASTVPVRTITASRMIPGIDFSDHLNYWNEGFPALMITDTSFYRNPNYHTENDTPDTLDYERMAQVVRGVANAVVTLALR